MDLVGTPGPLRPALPSIVTEPLRGTMERVPTQDLVARARAGDGDAYAMLFNRFHDEIYRFATRRLGDPDAGQDVAAETFTDAFASIRRFHWQGVPFEAWLYTIARRRVADHHRAQQRIDRATATEGRIRPVDDPSIAIHRELDMRALISQLPNAERDVIELRFMEDLDVEQTAVRLGKKAGTVRVAQHRALIRLRALIAGETS